MINLNAHLEHFTRKYISCFPCVSLYLPIGYSVRHTPRKNGHNALKNYPELILTEIKLLCTIKSYAIKEIEKKRELPGMCFL